MKYVAREISFPRPALDSIAPGEIAEAAVTQVSIFVLARGLPEPPLDAGGWRLKAGPEQPLVLNQASPQALFVAETRKPPGLSG